MNPSPVVLASASQSRATVLRNAGVVFTQHPANVDEDGVKATMRNKNDTVENCARALAEKKAGDVSGKLPQALVIGADQMLECENRWFDKPKDLEAARRQLLALRGKTHRLVNGIALVRDGRTLWRFDNAAQLTMRAFSDAFLEEYLRQAGTQICHSVGGYQLEGLGSQLFGRIEGDFFSILGLPLLPLLAVLREHGALTD